MTEELLGIACAIMGLGLLLAIPVVLAIVYARTRHIDRLVSRLERLEQVVYSQGLRGSPTEAAGGGPETEISSHPALSKTGAATPTGEFPPATVTQFGTSSPAAPSSEKLVEPVLVAERVDTAAQRLKSESVAWEQFIGRKALGWTAVIVLLFATAFFLRYAFENEWIGPLGRVALGIAAGAVLAWRGLSYQRRGWHVFAQMLLAASIVLIYLSTYSAFAFYHLLSQQVAGVFLIALVVESAIVALRMESPAIALMAVIGGLLTPMLMHTQHDQYASLFMYLAVLNVGVVLLLTVRRWFVVGSVALLGTQGLFWAWHAENYHPEKLPWAIGFQGVLWLLYFVDSFRPGRLGRRANSEELLRVLANAALWFGGAYALLREDFNPWMGTLAVSLAFVYALAAQYLLARNRQAAADDAPLVLANLTVACGLIALAFPLQAAAPWVALGWAAEAGVLWWFGLRIHTIPLRVMGAVLATATVVRIFVETPPEYRPPFRLILNDYALPSLAAVACLIFALAIGRRLFARVTASERTAMGMVFVGCTLLVWWIVSVDLYQYFLMAPGRLQGLDQSTQQRLSQMSLSAWWAVYASLVLAIGFRTRLSMLRWTALALFALTIAKVFLLDMSGLDQIYRIVAFFVLAVLLGLAAWAYQRQQPDQEADESA